LRSVREGLRELIACFPVYRSYVTEAGASEIDRERVDAAIAEARRRNPRMEASPLAFLRALILQECPECFAAEDRAAARKFAGKFQQLTAPVTAKGIEDTTFYQYNRLVALNEVGGDPDRFGTSAEELHAYFAERAAKWPWALSPLSTHDTKRSEDVRARIAMISELAEVWGEAVCRWRGINEQHREEAGPDRNDEYLLYQTLVGAWPMEGVAGKEFVKRIQAYMTKAMREAKVHTTWADPDGGYERAWRNWG
jgi:(1->4)-alpha-D-glucan 1-alpha-D-glucosylmutase